MNEHYELSIKRSSPVRRGAGHFVPMARTLCPDGPDTLSGCPVQLVRMTCSTCPDDLFKESRNLNYI